MKTPYYILIAVGMLVSYQASLRAQSSANVNCTASGRVILPIGVRGTHDLNFGRFTAPTLGEGTITLSASGIGPLSGQNPPAVTPSVTGGIGIVDGQTGSLPNGGLPVQLGTCEAFGEPGFWFLVTVPSGPVLLRNGLAGAPSMEMTAFTTNLASNLGQIGTGDVAGFLYFAVGATLNVAQNQPIGDYTGTYNVSVTYN